MSNTELVMKTRCSIDTNRNKYVTCTRCVIIEFDTFRYFKLQLSSFILLRMKRVFKPFVVQLVSISILKSKRVIGKIPWKIVNSRIRSVRRNRCCTPMNHCVKMDSWPAEIKTVSNVVCSVTAKRIVLTVPMKTVAVSVRYDGYEWEKKNPSKSKI